MDVLCQFRDDVRRLADQGKGPLLELSDKLRNEKLPEIGIELTDGGPGQRATWSSGDPKEIMEKLKPKPAKPAKPQDAKKLTPPEKLFIDFNDNNYTKFDD